jgi:hypothetical protein
MVRPSASTATAGGPKPKIDGHGQVQDVLHLYNVQNIEVRNLEIRNHGAERAVRRGVHIFLDNFGTGGAPGMDVAIVSATVRGSGEARAMMNCFSDQVL